MGFDQLTIRDGSRDEPAAGFVGAGSALRRLCRDAAELRPSSKQSDAVVHCGHPPSRPLSLLPCPPVRKMIESHRDFLSNHRPDWARLGTFGHKPRQSQGMTSGVIPQLVAGSMSRPGSVQQFNPDRRLDQKTISTCGNMFLSG
jgi:hypothetical protein